MAVRETLTIEQGADWSRTLRCKLSDGSYLDLSGYTARSQVRDDKDNLLVELTVSISGTWITRSLTATQTAALTGQGKHDLFLTSPTGVHTKLVTGPVDVLERVTR